MLGLGGELPIRASFGAQFSVDFGCAPDKLDALLKATFDAIAAMQKDGTTAENLDKVKQIYIRGHEAQLVQNGAWVAGLTQAFMYGDDPALMLNVQPLLDRITNDNVKAAAKRFLDKKRYVMAKMVPVAAVPAAAPTAAPAK